MRTLRWGSVWILSSAADVFRDYWRGRAGHAAVKVDWSSTWRNWCRREVAPHHQASEPPECDPKMLELALAQTRDEDDR